MTMMVGSWLGTGQEIIVMGLPLWPGVAVEKSCSSSGGQRNKSSMPNAGYLGEP